MPGALKRPSGSKSTRPSSAPRDSLPEADIRSFTLRVQGEVIDLVDEAVSKHPVIRNRNTWIVNAIVEQLKRERQS